MSEGACFHKAQVLMQSTVRIPITVEVCVSKPIALLIMIDRKVAWSARLSAAPARKHTLVSYASEDVGMLKL